MGPWHLHYYSKKTWLLSRKDSTGSTSHLGVEAIALQTRIPGVVQYLIIEQAYIPTISSTPAIITHTRKDPDNPP
jgi:hypothetical protein